MQGGSAAAQPALVAALGKMVVGKDNGLSLEDSMMLLDVVDCLFDGGGNAGGEGTPQLGAAQRHAQRVAHQFVARSAVAAARARLEELASVGSAGGDAEGSSGEDELLSGSDADGEDEGWERRSVEAWERRSAASPRSDASEYGNDTLHARSQWGDAYDDFGAQQQQQLQQHQQQQHESGLGFVKAEAANAQEEEDLPEDLSEEESPPPPPPPPPLGITIRTSASLASNVASAAAEALLTHSPVSAVSHGSCSGSGSRSGASGCSSGGGDGDMPSPRRLGERKRSMDDAELQQELEVSDDGSCCSGSNKRRAGSWTVAEDRALEEAVEQLGCKSWKRVSELVPGRTHWQCSQRWQKVLRPGLVKGPWTTEEDAVLSNEVARAEEALQAAAAASAASQNGISWTAVAACIPGRTAKQCRERYTLSLDPSISRSPWTEEEDQCIWQMHLVIGNQWAKIRQHCPNRTENQIKSRHKTLQQAFAKDKTTEWTPELEQRLAALALQFSGDLSKMRRHLPKELKGSSPAALMARCNSIHQG